MTKFSSGFTIVALTVLIDQATKYWVETSMAMQEQIRLLPFFSLFRTHNEGVAFSMLWGLGPWPLIIIALAVVCFVGWLWRANPSERWLSHLAYGLIIGGAIGNIIDRVMHGYVVDMFLFFLENWSFAVFNMADVAITVGAGLVILDEIITWHKGRTTQTGAE